MVIIKKGDEGTPVILVQGMLQKLGHRIKADGKFGPLTDEAVRGFQGNNGITVDGKVGEATALKFIEALMFMSES